MTGTGRAGRCSPGRGSRVYGGMRTTLTTGTCLVLLAGTILLGGCSSSFGGGGSAPARTYVILPDGSTAPVRTQPPTDP